VVEGAAQAEPEAAAPVVLGGLERLVAWGRKNSLWPFGFGLSCCFVEMATSLTPRYDIARFGAEVLRISPREADVMIVAGTVFRKMAPTVLQLYEQMMEPRWVISMGSCANSGGMYDVYSVVQGVDSFLPVDVYVEGCPPAPTALMEGLLLLNAQVQLERRPLSWVVGEQTVRKPAGVSLRDLKRPWRRTEGELAPPTDSGVPAPDEGPEVGPSSPASRAPAPPQPAQTTPRGPAAPPVLSAVERELRQRFPGVPFCSQITADGIPTLWLPEHCLADVLRYVKTETRRPFASLYDLGAIDERFRDSRDGQPEADFSVYYHLVSYARNADLRLKVALKGDRPAIDSVTGLWPCADWYEREVWDMFGIDVRGHPHLARLLSPPWWEGHPLRKEAPSRGTELGPFTMARDDFDRWQEDLRFKPGEWGLPRTEDEPTLMYLNIGPQHGATHGPFRVVVGLRDEEIVHCVPDIGFHHRGAEKMSERQTWHTFIPYTDRIDYLSGVMNNLPWVLTVERLCGIEVPDRAQVIRVMLAELFRVASHLVYYGTFAQDIGALSPVFYMFEDRERLFDAVIAPICGARMHPNWFRIGGVADDLPDGWEGPVREFLDYLPERLDEYDRLVLDNRILKARTVGVGQISAADAVEWGLTGPNLRAAGLPWDWRKQRPYSHYDWFDFDVPIGTTGDSYDRVAVHVEEMRQSLRIVRQCLDVMPNGPYKAYHPQATPPAKEPRTMHDIETLITHFLGVSWGPVVPPGEACIYTEGSKGQYSYYAVSDGGTSAYRTKIRTPSFPHLQVLPLLARGFEIADLVTILGSLDFVMGDVDR
jgi:NADH-quinone oxidoreductase subunit C/D